MSPETAPSAFARRLGRLLTLAYMISFAVLLLAAGGFVLWERFNSNAEASSALALNQLRMLAVSSQKVVLQAIRHNQGPGADKERLAIECQKSLADFRSLAADLGGVGGAPYSDLAPKVERFGRRIESILAMRPGVPLAREDYESLYLLATELAGQIDKVSEFETRAARQQAERHQQINWAFLGALALLVATAVLLVFRPLTQKLSREAGELETSAGRLLQKTESEELETTVWSLFVCHAGQRIRKAVNDIIERASALETELIAKRSGENADYAAWIRERGTQILGVVNDELNLAFIEAGLTPMMPRAINLSQILEDMTPHLRPMAEDKGLVFTLNLPPLEVWVMGDADQIWRMIEKIFHNAIKYTHHGEVSITASALPDGRATVAVRDTGCGISAEALPHIFEPQPFEEEAETALDQGLGINLSVAQQLAAHMRSVISVHSEPDKGTTFLIDMPGCTPEGQLLAR